MAAKKEVVGEMTEHELRNRIAELEKSLDYANLRNEALELMIDIAERQEGIRIRKESGAKRSWEWHPGIPLDSLSGLLGNTRRAYYKKKRTDERMPLHSGRVIREVRSVREQDPGVGAYKLFFMPHDVFGGRVMGRDRFYSVLRRNGLMLPPQRRRHTTNSNHNYRKYGNPVKGFAPRAPNEPWVADITYADTDAGVMCLHLLTDAFTREIIGRALSESLTAANAMGALRQGITRARGYDLSKQVHHSDRGSRYCSNDYVDLLRGNGVSISMTEGYKPTDNAIAERVNGIIKVERLYRIPRFRDREEARRKLAGIIGLYNTRRPHMSNNMLTPEGMRKLYGH